MKFIPSVVAVLVVLCQASLAVGQQAFESPIQRRDSDERCTPDEPKCDQGFIRVKWPQPNKEHCAKPIVLPRGAISQAAPTVVEIVVDATGKVEGVQVNQSSGDLALDQALVSAASKCRFTPGSRGGTLTALKTMWIYDWKRSGAHLAPAPVLVAPPPSPRPTRPQIEHCPKPEYPLAALRAEVQGTTIIKLSMNSSGKVTEAEVVQSSGESREHGLLDKAAHDALRNCRFNAVEGAGERTTRLSYTFSFTVEDDPKAPK
jgi:TonB family protein